LIKARPCSNRGAQSPATLQASSRCFTANSASHCRAVSQRVIARAVHSAASLTCARQPTSQEKRRRRSCSRTHGNTARSAPTAQQTSAREGPTLRRRMSAMSNNTSSSLRSDVTNVQVAAPAGRDWGPLTSVVRTPWMRVHGRSRTGTVYWGHVLVPRWLADPRRCAGLSLSHGPQWTIFRGDCAAGEPPAQAGDWDPDDLFVPREACTMLELEAAVRARLAGELPAAEGAADAMARALFYGCTPASVDSLLPLDLRCVEQRWNTTQASTLLRSYAMRGGLHPDDWPSCALPFESALPLVARRACALRGGELRAHAGHAWRLELARLRRARAWAERIAALRRRHELVVRDERMRRLALQIRRLMEPGVPRTFIEPAGCTEAMRAAAAGAGPRLGNHDRWMFVQHALLIGMAADRVRGLLHARAHRVYRGAEVLAHVREADDMIRRALRAAAPAAGCRALQARWCPFAALGLEGARQACGRRAPFLAPA